MNKILELLNQKQKVFEKDLAFNVLQLEKLKKEAKSDPERGFEVTMKKLPPLQSNLVALKMSIALLLELKKEIQDLNKEV